jgi:glycerol uptake facilitator-like aquaporin
LPPSDCRGGDVALALLANTLATGSALVVLIATLAPISGAHLNPVVTFAAWMGGALRRRDAGVYVLAQLLGAILGAGLADLMFGLPAFSLSTHARSGPRMFLSEVVASFGLLLVISLARRARHMEVAILIACYVSAAYWFTPSTSFANPAVTVARSLTDTFAGIRPMDVPAFLMAQAIGATLGVVAGGVLEGHTA